MSKVYINLIDQKEPTLNFQKNEKENLDTVKKKILYFKKVVKPTVEEKNEHSQYLKKSLKNNFFN